MSRCPSVFLSYAERFTDSLEHPPVLSSRLITGTTTVSLLHRARADAMTQEEL